MIPDGFSRGNGDSIKHAYHMIQVLLKNSETESMTSLPSVSKSKPMTTSTSHDHEDETLKTPRANIGPRLQNHGKKVSVLIELCA